MSETQGLGNLIPATNSASLQENRRAFSVSSNAIAGPLLILAPPRSFTSVVCAMLGQHPQMYGLPETLLFCAETMTEWWERGARATFKWDHGLVRAVAQLYFGKQTEFTVRLARGWLVRRSHFTTGCLLEELANKVRPLILVDKSPNIVYRMESMLRAYRMFPQARFIHLLRHPRGYGESVMSFLQEKREISPVQPEHWLARLASYQSPSTRERKPAEGAHIDPQRSWYSLNINICEFLNSVPQYQKMRISAEDLLTDPDRSLWDIACWMGLRTDRGAVEAMKHPECSPYACLGPPNAPFGNDYFFLKSPVLRPERARPLSLEGPLSWRKDGQGFSPEVKELATKLGYT